MGFWLGRDTDYRSFEPARRSLSLWMLEVFLRRVCCCCWLSAWVSCLYQQTSRARARVCVCVQSNASADDVGMPEIASNMLPHQAPGRRKKVGEG